MRSERRSSPGFAKRGFFTDPITTTERKANMDETETKMQCNKDRCDMYGKACATCSGCPAEPPTEENEESEEWG